VTVVAVDDPVERSRLCESILRDLPEWFGIEAGTAVYVRDVAELPTFAVGDDGFIALKLHLARAAEVYVMGVRRELQGHGLGTRLLATAEDDLRRRGVEYLQVKTLASSHPSEHYGRTRRFYESSGFVGLEVLPTLWGEANPCLVMVKRI
jgi:GNAT superfamily N-acetyltransferase